MSRVGSLSNEIEGIDELGLRQGKICVENLQVHPGTCHWLGRETGVEVRDSRSLEEGTSE